MKKVSVIIPMHNSFNHIQQCVESVINQTYKNTEIILVDDASTDSTLEIVKKYQKNATIGIANNQQKNIEKTDMESKVSQNTDIKIIELKENVGAGIARNKGIEVASGDYICFLDSDDYWVLDKLERQVKFMEKNNYVFIYGGYDYLKNKKRKKAKVPKTLNYNQLLKNCAIFTSTVMLNMEHLSKEEIYMPDFRRGQDYGCWYSILKKGITAYAITDTLAVYRVGEKSLSSNKFKATNRTWNLLKREKLGFGKRWYCFICYGFNAVKRRMGL